MTTTAMNVVDGTTAGVAAAGKRVPSPRPMPGHGDGGSSAPKPTPTTQPVAVEVEVSPSSTSTAPESVGPVPILRGTLSRDPDHRRDVIRGKWSQRGEGNTTEGEEKAAQTFEMVRVWRKEEGEAREEEEDAAAGSALAADVVDGPYRSSFVMSFPTSRTKTRVVRERGLRLSFTKRRVVVGGMKDCHYDISGSGSNQFGPFRLEGRATPNEPAARCGDAGRTFSVEIRKEYLPLPSSPAPKATDEVVRTLRTKRSYDKEERSDARNTKKPRTNDAIATSNHVLLDGNGVEYVTRADYDRLFDTMRDLRAQMAQLGEVLAATKVVVVGENGEQSTPAKTSASGFGGTADKDAVPSLVEDDDSDDGDAAVKGGNTRKEERKKTVEESPLTIDEQRELAAAVARIRSDVRLQGVADIIRKSASWIGGDDDEIELDIDRLDAATQRKLQRFVMKGTKRTKRPRGPSKSSKCTKSSKKVGDLLSPPNSADTRNAPSLPTRPRKARRSASSLSSFMAFGRNESTETEAQASKASNDGGVLSTPRSDSSNRGDNDLDDVPAVSGVNWDAAAKAGSTKTRGGDVAADDDENIAGNNDSWTAAQKQAAAVRVREAAQKARVEKVRADALLASRRRLAEDVALARERREAQAAAEARLYEKKRRDEEAARQAARDAVRARTAAVKPTVDLQPLSVRVPSEGFLDASPCASPLDFGF